MATAQAEAHANQIIGQAEQQLEEIHRNERAARQRLLGARTDLQQAMQIQSEFLRSQFTNAGEHMRQMTTGVMSGGDVYGGKK